MGLIGIFAPLQHAASAAGIGRVAELLNDITTIKNGQKNDGEITSWLRLRTIETTV